MAESDDVNHPAYVRGRLDATIDDVKELKAWKNSTTERLTTFETQLDSVPDRVADRLAASRASRGQDPASSTSSTAGSGSPADPKNTVKPSNQEPSDPAGGPSNDAASGKKIDPPPVKPNPADKRDDNGGTSSEPAPTKSRRGFFQRLR